VNYGLQRIRQAALSPFDVKVLRTLAEAGGEAPLYVDRLRPETRDAKIAGINDLIARDFVEVDAARSTGHRWQLRLTDEGRSVWAEVDHIERPSASRVEVPSSVVLPDITGGC